MKRFRVSNKKLVVFVLALLLLGLVAAGLAQEGEAAALDLTTAINPINAFFQGVADALRTTLARTLALVAIIAGGIAKLIGYQRANSILIGAIIGLLIVFVAPTFVDLIFPAGAA